MLARQQRGFGGVARQELEEFAEARLVPAELRRKLPEDRPELFTQAEHPGSEVVCQRLADVAQLLHVRDEAGALECENKIVRRLAIPFLEAARALQRIESPVDLDRIESAAG